MASSAEPGEQNAVPVQGPARIGPYRLARRLGQGGMGEVFLAWDERLGRRVAIKRIRSDRPTAERRERLRREAAAAARLSHPAVVQVYDLVEDADGDAIVLEYAEGRTLSELLADGPMAAATAVRLAWEIAEGLAAAHAAGLVHRDLKAENVVVTPEGRAKILDFGIAKALTGGDDESLTATGAVLGTCRAMSPEQARGEEVDARSDLFSLGVLIYEMLADRSPFRGANPLETIQRVLEYHPPALISLRPALPRRLSSLVDWLLAKRREDRPRNAGVAARELAAVAGAMGAATPTLEHPDGADGREDDLPTVVEPVSRHPLAAGGSLTWVSSRARRPPLILLGVVLLAALAVAGANLLRLERPATLRVAVPPPRLLSVSPGTASGNAGEGLDLVSSALLNAALSSLAALEDLAPLEIARPANPSPVAVARAAAADEVLTIALQTQGSRLAQVLLRRVQGRDGRVLWAGSFPIDPEPRDRNLRLLADAVTAQLRRAYPGRRLRPGVPELEAADRDYAELLRIKTRLSQGGVPQEEDLERLDAVLRGSPRFLEAYLLLADAAQNLFRSTRETAYLDRAARAAGEAARLAPGDPRPLVARFQVALTGNRIAEARAALDELARMTPGDPQLHKFSGQLAARQGDLLAARAELMAAAESAPSWANLYDLADLEIRAGRIADARAHLEELLARSPGNLYGLDRLGNLELLEGDPRRAEQIYLDMIHREPQRSSYTNLGLARSLLGRHAEAVAAYRQALALAPEHTVVLINLADAEVALGREAEARDLYRRTLARLEEVESKAGLSPIDSMSKAQCLVHLGRTQDAVALTQRILRTSGDDREILYAASLVHALAGDRTSALVNARLALDAGVEPRWFTLPAFGALRQDPELQALLRRPRAAPGNSR